MDLKREIKLVEVLGWRYECEHGTGIKAYKILSGSTGSTVHMTFNFSTWECFGTLWEWIHDKDHEEERRLSFYRWYADLGLGDPVSIIDMVNPDRFADFVYEWIKDEEER